MALTVLQEPEALSFAGNPVVYRVQSNNYLETAGVTFVGVLDKSGTFTVGQKLVFRFGDNELVEMVGAAVPDDSGYQFLADAGAPVSAEDFAVFFRNNYILNKYYVISAAGTQVVFTARDTGSEFNWQSPAGVLSVSTAGVTAKERENFRVMFDVFFRRNGASDFENIYSEEIHADEPLSGLFSIDIGRNLNAALEHDVPDFNSPLPFKCQHSKGEYYCQYAEVYGSTAVARKPVQGAVKHVAKGGLSHVGFKTKALLNILSPDVADASKDLFLKQGARKIRTRTNQPEFLFFLNLRGHSSLKLRTTVSFTEGGTATHTSTAVAVAQYDKVGFACGFDLLALGDLDAAKTVKEYSCRLLNQADAVVSEAVTFVMDYERREVVRYFSSSSSLGGFDCLPCYGKGSEEFELSQSTAERPVMINYDLKDGKVVNYDLKLQRSFQVATGFLDKRRFDLLADFFLAERKFVVRGAVALPITVTNQKAGQFKDKQGLITQAIEYRYNHDDAHYTEGDAEDSGNYIEGFFFTSNLGYSPAGSDPVALHIRAITPQQILGWDSVYAAWQNGEIGGSASWDGILDKPATFAPSAHTHAIADISGLQSALNGKLSGNVNDWVRNQGALQDGSRYHVEYGRVNKALIFSGGVFDPAELQPGEYALYIDEVGTGGTAPDAIVNLGDLLNVDVAGVADNYVMYYEAATGKYKFKAATFGGTPVDAYTKSEINAFFGGITGITGYNKANWDAAHGWGNHAGLYLGVNAKAVSAGTADNAWVINPHFINTDTMNQNFSTGIYRNENGLGGNIPYAPVFHASGSDTGWQLTADYGTSSNTLAFRSTYSNTFGPWRTVWHNGNLDPSRVVTGGTWDIRFVNRNTWGGGTYPTIHGTHADEWVMFHNIHIPYLNNGSYGYAGSYGGSRIRMAAQVAAIDYWDIGVLSEDQYYIQRNGVSMISIDNGGVVKINKSLKIPAKNSAGSLTGNYYEIYVEE